MSVLHPALEQAWQRQEALHLSPGLLLLAR